MIGETVSHYKILEKLGEGGMGVVYKAMDTKLKRTVAVKFLTPGALAGDEERARFIREAQTAAALRHPGICTVFEIDEAQSHSFIVMEFIEGQSLKEKIASGPLDLEGAVGIVVRLAGALEEAHKKGIVHRDVKPANVVLTPDGQPVLTDFGLAKSAGSDKVTKTGTTIGTVAYMSPEQARGEDVDHRTDIWSMGVVLYEMLTGVTPFKGEFEPAVIYSILNSDPVAPREIRRGIPEDLERIVLKAIQKDPAQRPQSASEVREALIPHSAAAVDSSQSEQVRGSFLRGSRRLAIVFPVVLAAFLVSILVVNYVRKVHNEEWAREEALPAIGRMVEAEEYFSAYLLAQRVAEIIPSDPTLTKLSSELTETVSIHSSPEGADVFFKEYRDAEGPWISLGRTPLAGIPMPKGFFRWKVEKDGYELPVVAGGSDLETLEFTLSEIGTVPEGMVLVPAGERRAVLVGLDPMRGVELTDFYIDRLEVTNRQFQAFVDSGGYERPEFWKHDFLEHGRRLPWDEAMSLFKDATGRPGPSTWELGRYPEGREDHPVTGVSWYEAAAYAEFAGKMLPTVNHWTHAATILESGQIIPVSNFGGDGPVRVGSKQGLGYFGTYDMAGNAREWCYNSNGEGHYILGGSWSDPPYMFYLSQNTLASDRSDRNGFRCVIHVSHDSSLVAAKKDLPELPARDFKSEKPVSDEVFRAYLEMFVYERTPLNAEIELVDNEPEHWTIEKISYDAGYGSERMFAYLFLPRGVSPPYQTLVLFPGAYALQMKSSANGRKLNSWDAVDFIVKSGRAVLCPAYKSTYERSDGFHPYRSGPPTSRAYRERFLLWWKDLSRSIDYLESRPDIDGGKIGYVGSSWGAWMAPMFLGQDDRYKVAVLRLGGFFMFPLPPWFDPFNFASRVKIPVLMLNGKYDYLFPHHASQLPMFEALGTSPEDKRLVLFETDHTVYGYRNMMIREVLDWLDRYLGPVN